MRFVLVACCAVAALAVAPAPAAPAGCNPGVRKVEGVTARVFCGPAKATVHVGGKTLTFSGGRCEVGEFGLFAVDIGTVFVGPTTSKRPFFGLAVVKPKPGTYRNQGVSWRAGGVMGSAVATVTLKTLQSGTFTGHLLGSSTRISGSFTC